jgi:signal recognition particle receptor subunit beta
VLIRPDAPPTGILVADAFAQRVKKPQHGEVGSMVVFNYSGREINAKIVYYGPGLSGKTTNLEHIYNKTAPHLRGKMVSMKTKVDRTLFFDFLPIQGGEVAGFNIRFLLYTVPGQVYYNATRKLVLKGADAIVFVADSQAEEMAANRESLKNLQENLTEHGKDLNQIPLVVQYNKRDLPSALPIDKLEAELNPRGVPSFESVATSGNGVFETLTAATRMVLDELRDQLVQDKSSQNESDGREISFGTVGQAEQDSSTMKDKVSDVPSPGEEPSPVPVSAGDSCPSYEGCQASSAGAAGGGFAGTGTSGYAPPIGSGASVGPPPGLPDVSIPEPAGAGRPALDGARGGRQKVRIPIRLGDPDKAGHVVVNLAVDIEIVVDEDRV